MADNQITYDDILKPTDSITKAINEYTQLINMYDDAVSKVKGDAKTILESVNKISGATKKQREYRIEFMKNIANLLQTKHKIDAQYDSRSTTASTSGFVSVAGTNLKFYVKDGKKQGDSRAGVANELNLVKLIKDQINRSTFVFHLGK